MKRLIVIVLILALSGCATWRRMNGEPYKNATHQFEAVVPDGWMRFGVHKHFLATRDGTALNVILVDRHKMEKKLEFTKNKFLPDMTPSELADVEIDDFKSNSNVDRFEVTANQPVTIDAHPAFRIDYTYVTRGGLKMKGTACGFIHDQWIYRIRFEAAEQFYYAKTAADFESFLQSFVVTSSSQE